MKDSINKNPSSPGSQEIITEKRREKRFDAPEDSRQYIKLLVKNGGDFVPAALANFSRNGILFASPVPFTKGQQASCILSVSLLFSRDVSFDVEVKYCYADHGSHITGASIEAISDKVWFDVFVEVYDFIVLRQGSG